VTHAYRILVGKPYARVHLEDLGVVVRTVFTYIFKKWDWEAWTGLIWLRIGTGNGR